jgi:hypothetical protein
VLLALVCEIRSLLMRCCQVKGFNQSIERVRAEKIRRGEITPKKNKLDQDLGWPPSNENRPEWSSSTAPSLPSEKPDVYTPSPTMPHEQQQQQQQQQQQPWACPARNSPVKPGGYESRYYRQDQARPAVPSSPARSTSSAARKTLLFVDVQLQEGRTDRISVQIIANTSTSTCHPLLTLFTTRSYHGRRLVSNTLKTLSSSSSLAIGMIGTL